MSVRARRTDVRKAGADRSDHPRRDRPLEQSIVEEPDHGRLASVYVLYDRAGDVLYVGMTAVQGLQRFGQHRAKTWWPQVHHITVEHFPRVHLARLRERELIRSLRPLHNRVLNTRPQIRRRPKPRVSSGTRQPRETL